MSSFVLTILIVLIILAVSLAWRIHKVLDAEGEVRVRLWYIWKLDTRTCKGKVLSCCVRKYMNWRGWTIV